MSNVITDPDLREILIDLRREILMKINCHAIATVEEFDSETQTITAKMNYTKTFYSRQGQPDSQVSYPILVSVPVVILQGGGGQLTFPIAAGDQCLILFNDRDIENWYSGALSGPVKSGRLHSFSDAIALVGLYNKQSALSDYDTTRIRIEYSGGVFGVGEKILIENDTTSLKTVLSDLMTAIGNLNTLLTTAFGTNAVPGSPLFTGWAAGLAPITTELSAVSTKIGALLDES